VRRLNSVNQEEVEAWKDTFLPHLMAKYSQKGMFSINEIGSFYNILPDRTCIF
jgi:hypothetical protein